MVERQRHHHGARQIQTSRLVTPQGVGGELPQVDVKRQVRHHRQGVHRPQVTHHGRRLQHLQHRRLVWNHQLRVQLSHTNTHPGPQPRIRREIADAGILGDRLLGDNLADIRTGVGLPHFIGTHQRQQVSRMGEVRRAHIVHRTALLVNLRSSLTQFQVIVVDLLIEVLPGRRTTFHHLDVGDEHETHHGQGEQHRTNGPLPHGDEHRHGSDHHRDHGQRENPQPQRPTVRGRCG